jgi:DNA-binding Lrp family transcriptional regulator
MKYAVSAQHKDGAIPMDAIDRKILAILQEDSSVAISEIAARVGLSATP